MSGRTNPGRTDAIPPQISYIDLTIVSVWSWNSWGVICKLNGHHFTYDKIVKQVLYELHCDQSLISVNISWYDIIYDSCQQRQWNKILHLSSTPSSNSVILFLARSTALRTSHDIFLFVSSLLSKSFSGVLSFRLWYWITGHPLSSVILAYM